MIKKLMFVFFTLAWAQMGWKQSENVNLLIIFYANTFLLNKKKWIFKISPFDV